MKLLNEHESEIEGKLFSNGSEVEFDEKCKRIEWLTSSVLNKVSVNSDGWETLFRDPKDKRLWVLYYPQSELHGGGPPSLCLVSKEEAELKFSL